MDDDGPLDELGALELHLHGGRVPAGPGIGVGDLLGGVGETLGHIIPELPAEGFELAGDVHEYEGYGHWSEALGPVRLYDEARFHRLLTAATIIVRAAGHG